MTASSLVTAHHFSAIYRFPLPIGKHLHRSSSPQDQVAIHIPGCSSRLAVAMAMPPTGMKW
ncbi:hypothetical protein [Acidithiobacillus ferrooxidans]|uniref:hypothetical protein n=1 Tax=Acidithiobacillus ferrooxidans TaxID=920 RepID=UPI000B0C86E6|nr:hypothetical protein [Acidithiobacillus ferrooxidans]